MTANKWTESDDPDQSGRVAVITGSNTGLGYETAGVLAARGAHMVLAVRNVADVEVLPLDVSSLQSVRTATDEIKTAYPRIDLLINNAGVMYVPKKEATKDGFEMPFATNHLGDGIGEVMGYPKLVKSSPQSHDEALQKRLWTVSEELTGVTFPV